jgi:hypothetical protein
MGRFRAYPDIFYRKLSSPLLSNLSYPLITGQNALFPRRLAA